MGCLLSWRVMWWNCTLFAIGWVLCLNHTLYDWLWLILQSLDSMLAYHNSQHWQRSKITWQTYEDSDDDAQRINMRTPRRMCSAVAWWWSWTTEIGAVEWFWFHRKLLSNGALRTWQWDFSWRKERQLWGWTHYDVHTVCILSMNENGSVTLSVAERLEMIEMVVIRGWRLCQCHQQTECFCHMISLHLTSRDVLTCFNLSCKYKQRK